MASNTIDIPSLENVPLTAGALGNVVTLRMQDDAIADAVAAGYDRLVVERSEDSGFSWQENTQPDTRPVLEAGTTQYLWVDRAGGETFLYRYKYLATTGPIQGQCTEPSESILGEGLAIQRVLTVPQLKARYLHGIDLTDDSGAPLSDDAFTHYILSAVRWMERQLDIPIIPTTFCERHDYVASDFEHWGFLQLDNYPLISVESYRAYFTDPGSYIEYPQDWWRIDPAAGHIRIVPNNTSTLGEYMIGNNYAIFPSLIGRTLVPDSFEILYTAGFRDGRIPRDVLDLIGMAACLGPFNILGDLIAGAGIATVSLSMDGLSQTIGTTSSATNAGYGARIKQYLDQIKKQMPALKQHYKRIKVALG